jgi:hypothetical protein
MGFCKETRVISGDDAVRLWEKMQNPTPMPPEHWEEIVQAMKIYNRQKARREAREAEELAAATAAATK